jgi:phosphatidylserine/phosphatidylglycerophosphate/cardiolipin synthase-like enzyme
VKPLLCAIAALSLAHAGDARIETHFAPTGQRRRLEKVLCDEIRRARTEVLVALFHFTSDRLSRALTERASAGVRVRLLLDASQADPAFVAGLRARGLDVRRVTPRGEEGARFHHKYCVLDEVVNVLG